MPSSASSDTSFALTLNRFGLRFLERDAERTYAAWRNEQNLRQIRLAGGVGIPLWLAFPLIGYFSLPDLDWFGVFWPGYVAAVAIALATAVTYSRFRWAATLLTGGAFVVVSCMIVLIAVVAGPIVGMETTSAAMAMTMLMVTFAVFMQFPPLIAAAANVPFLTAMTLLVVYRGQTNAISAFYEYLYLGFIGGGYFLVVAMTLGGERFLRRAFITEQLLARQTSALQESRNRIRRYVPPTLAEQIIDGNFDGIEAPQRRRITILFADIVGFTDMADRVEPEILSQVIGEYMGTMADIVDRHGGTVNEFIGDGLMALFGAPRVLGPEEQARSAVRAAQAMRAKLPELNASWRKLGLGTDLRTRIGINTGMASVGSYGSEGRMTYTAIGLQTNIAARLQSHCAPGDILISDATWQLVRDDIECRSLGEVECKGVHFPVAVYAPIGRATG